MSDKPFIVAAVCVCALFAYLAHEAAEVGKARAATELERTKACAAAGKQMQPVKIEAGQTIFIELECK